MMRISIVAIAASAAFAFVMYQPRATSAQIIIQRPPTYMGQPNPLSDDEARGNLQRQKEHDEEVKREQQKRLLEEALRPQIQTYSYEYSWSYVPAPRWNEPFPRRHW